MDFSNLKQNIITEGIKNVNYSVENEEDGQAYLSEINKDSK